MGKPKKVKERKPKVEKPNPFDSRCKKSLDTYQDTRERNLSRTDVINEVVFKHKQAKAMRQMAKDDLTLQMENIDRKFQHLKSKGVMENLLTAEASERKRPSDLDAYDEIFNSLTVNAGKRAIPQISERQKAEREARKLDELEKDRRRRMDSDDEDSDGDHRAGVDEERPMPKKKKLEKGSVNITFDDAGNLLTSLDDLKSKTPAQHIGADEEIDDFYVDDSDAEDEEADEFEDEEGAEDDLEAEDEEVGSEDEAEDAVGDDSEEEEEADEDIDHADDKSAGEEVEEHDDTLPTLKTRPTASKIDHSNLPFTFDLPKTYIEFRTLYTTYFTDQWITLTERLIKCHHPSLHENNKRKMGKMFRFCLRFYDALAKANNMDQLKQTVEVLRCFQKLNPFAAARSTRALLIYKRNSFRPTSGATVRASPTLDYIAFFTVVAELFPTSDRYHPVCTPTLVFALEVLRLSEVNSLKTAGVLIFLCKILMKWVQESQRYLPEVIAATRLLLQLAVEKRKVDLMNDPLTYRTVSRKNNVTDVLRVTGTAKKVSLKKPLDPLALFSEKDLITEKELRCQLLRSLFTLIDATSSTYERLQQAYGAIFSPQLSFLQRIDKKHFPAELTAVMDATINELNEKITQFNARSSRQRRAVTKVKMIKMLEPVIEEDFDADMPLRGSRNRDKNADINRLRKNVRNERRRAIKDLRADAGYLAATQQIRDNQIRTERNVKTKRIISSLQMQESEYKKRKLKKF